MVLAQRAAILCGRFPVLLKKDVAMIVMPKMTVASTVHEIIKTVYICCILFLSRSQAPAWEREINQISSS